MYNGWKNWETWNVALWCDNEYAVYQDRVTRNPRTAQEVEDFVREWWPDGTPDMRGETDDAFVRDARIVDWQEIAEHWAEE